MDPSWCLKWITLLPALIVSVSSASVPGKVVACYVGTWAVYRPGRGSFSFTDIDGSLCTHLIYSFAGLDSEKWEIKSLDPWNDLTDGGGKGNYMNYVALKKKHRDLKVNIAIGGANEDSAKYSQMVDDEAKRSKFVKSVRKFLGKYDFDGIDIDWEFPTQKGGKPADRQNLVYLCKELKQELEKDKKMVTVAISANPTTMEQGYDLSQLSKHVDYIHLMAYDYHGNWGSTSGANAPLGPATDPFTIESSVNAGLKLGVPEEKLVVGLALYGRTFITSEPPQNSSRALGEATKVGAGFQRQFTRTDGFLGFNEICLELKKGDWEEHWDSASSTPFLTNEDQIITYDNTKSLALKVQYVEKMKLAGVFVWSIDTDDFHGDCSKSRFPLLKSLSKPKKQGKGGESILKSSPVLVLLTVSALKLFYY